TTFNSSGQLTASGVGSAGNNIVMVFNPNSLPSNYVYITLTSGNGGGGGTLSIAPNSVSVIQGLTQQFAASLNGAPASVTWSATAGNIDAAGVYTAPAAIP